MLPEFPNLFAQNVTEERFERIVQSLFDRADTRLMNGRVSQEEYDAWVKQLNKWESDFYSRSYNLGSILRRS